MVVSGVYIIAPKIPSRLETGRFQKSKLLQKLG